MGILTLSGYSPLTGWKNILLITYFLSQPLIIVAYIGLDARHAFQLELTGQSIEYDFQKKRGKVE